ncbi:MAG: TRAP transporter small permease [Burkholderiales bacterium]|nr:TRAP transporter small permease [Burkholderiales bacterium]
MHRLVLFAERAGGVLLFLVMCLVTASAASRYAFARPMLDGDDLARLLLLPAILFGLVGACLHGEHIQVDLLWERLGPVGRRRIDVGARAVTLLIVGAMAIASIGRVFDIYSGRQGTFELRMPFWPFFAAASVGLCCAALVLAIHAFRGGKVRLGATSGEA